MECMHFTVFNLYQSALLYVVHILFAQMLEDYVKGYSIAPDVKICDSTWSIVFESLALR